MLIKIKFYKIKKKEFKLLMIYLRNNLKKINRILKQLIEDFR